MSANLSRLTGLWLESVLARLGVPEAKRQEHVASASITLAGIRILFLQPPYGENSFVVARAIVGDLPPAGHCEALFQLVLEVQGVLCGPHTPVLGLDWPARRLLVSCSLDMSSLTADDAAAILRSVQQMARQWRDAIANRGTPPVRPARTAVQDR